MSGDDSFPKAGIKVKYLLDEFLDAANTIGDIGDRTTTREVREKFIMALTEKTKSSYCQMLKDQEHWAYVDDPDAFISHAHGHKFKELLNALEWKFHQEPEASVWLDLFSINQHEPMDWTFDWLSTTFRSNVAGIGRTVMVMSPWNNPYPYSRTWCIFEAFSTVAEGGKFEIALSKTDEEAFLNEIRRVDAGDKMGAMVATIRAKNSECSVESDRVSIYKIIQETLGFAKLDTMLFDCYRRWVIDVAASAVDSCSDKEQQLELYFSIVQLYFQQGNLEQAEHYGRRALDASRVVHGGDLSTTLRAMHHLADVLRCQGHYGKAVELYQPCLERRKVLLGDDHPDTLCTMNNLAIALDGQGQYSKATELYVSCLDRRKVVLGEDHHDTLRTMNALGIALLDQDQYNKALQLLQQCLDRRKVLLGEDHPDTLRTMNGLALAFHNQGRYEEAAKLHHQCLERQKVVLGEDHPCTLGTMNNLGYSFHCEGQHNKAIDLYRLCFDRQKEVLGEDHPDTLRTKRNLQRAVGNNSKGPS